MVATSPQAPLFLSATRVPNNWVFAWTFPVLVLLGLMSVGVLYWNVHVDCSGDRCVQVCGNW